MQTYHKFLDTLKYSVDQLEEDSSYDSLYSPERLEELAQKLAKDLVVGTNKSIKRKSLRHELKNNKKLLDSAYQTLVTAMQMRQPVSPASEWFVDNFHHIQDQLQEINQNLTHKYYNNLPVVLEGELSGYPRVYAIALSFVTHTDNHLAGETLERYLLAYQKVSPLLMEELWALIITFRVVLLQHLTMRAMRLIFARFGKKKADILAEQLFEFMTSPGVTESDIKKFLDNHIHDFGRTRRSFIVRLTQRLRDQDSDVSPAFDWIENKLKQYSTTVEKLSQKEIHIQATSQTSVGNIISSMRLISSLDWKIFFERINLIDPILTRDHSRIYEKMDFVSRDSYRHSVEIIAKSSPLTEQEVALKAVKREGHVGYHLIGEGARQFKKDCAYNPYITNKLRELILTYPTFFYLGTLTFLTTVFIVPIIIYYISVGGGPLLAIVLSCLAILLTTELALSFLNLYVNHFLKPHVLPRLDTERDLSENASTMVVIPTLFTNLESVKNLVESLEIHALANREDHIYFALIGDFGDAKQEQESDDKFILESAISKIQLLNDKYATGSYHIFHLFHRKRLWNKSENRWIGWERKRGKLTEFNRLIRGATDTTFIVATAPMELCLKIKYVITLDSDTLLPRGAAKKLISTIIHPLNHPIVDKDTLQVVSGHGVLQPRISVTATSALRTHFSKISSGNTGIDPYTTAVSDVYQDLFGEGSYTGKGLYVVDTFEHVMEGRVPDNLVLSHDLFEGIFARCALVSDVELYDDYPADYDTFVKRCHRWVRGDWQISLWISPWVVNNQNKWVRNKISIISRWKILDNLRRSLVPKATLIWLLLAWTILPGSPVVWTIMVAAIFLFPVYAPFANGQWVQKGNVTWQGHILAGLRETKMKLAQIFITLAFLPTQAWVQCDAIVRSLYRLLFSKKSLLEWNPFAQSNLNISREIILKDFINNSTLTAIVMGLIVYFVNPDAFKVAAPFFLLWLLNPIVKKYLLHNASHKIPTLEVNEIKSFRFYARSTWYFFEKFVTKQGQWLAPDNYQENPCPVVAYRTSPTNIGLQLLSYASAYDLGYIAHTELIKRIEMMFNTLEKLPKIHGHFLNWYDIESLSPLLPRYISTVDSGNLAGHLITFKQFLIALENSKRPYSQLIYGIEDTVTLIISQKNKICPPPSNEFLIKLEKSLGALSKQLTCLRTSIDRPWQESLVLMLEASLATKVGLENLSSEIKIDVICDLNERLINQLKTFIDDIALTKTELLPRQNALIRKVDLILNEMNFSFLFDYKRKLFKLGFNVEENTYDNSYYDLLASEARLASFVAIAKGDIPMENWFRLGRQIAAVKGVKALSSWSASMFEYLMPILVMKRFEETLLDETYQSVVKRQREYGKEKKVPWGISESAYNARDLQMNYQYGPFGVPGLGLKRGLSNELVISPYSTMLAAMIEPKEALSNLEKLVNLGAFSTYGFYEAIDYTVERLPYNSSFIVIQSYMAHHQGMSLVSLNNVLNENIMRKRFHNDPSVLATELLLQERIPKPVEITMPRKEEVDHSGFLHSLKDYCPREYEDVNLSLPRTQILSNGHYSSVLTSTGSGFSRFGEFLLTRWREDSTRDHWGQYYYIRNLSIGDYWSATFQPLGRTADKFVSDFSEDRVRFFRSDKNFITRTEIVVSPEDSVELRKITITNETSLPQELEVTSFMELALARARDDMAHPSFSKLFIQTKLGTNKDSLLATRRRRSGEQKELWAFHTASFDLPLSDEIEYETNRLLFLGRGRSAQNPLALQESKPLSNTVGSVLDPIFSLRLKFIIPAGESLRVVFSTGMCENETRAHELIAKYSDSYTYKRESEMAWIQAQIQLRHLNISSFKAHLYQKLAGRILYLDGSLRPNAQTIRLNSRIQSDFWRYGISGDLPIVLLELSSEKDIQLFKDLLKAHEYLRLKGLVFDLIALNINSASYLLSLQDELLRQVRMSSCQGLLNKQGGVFLLRSDLMSREDIILFRSHSRTIFKGELGYLEDQLRHRRPRIELPILFKPTKDIPRYKKFVLEMPKLEFFNGLGGFCLQNNEYQIWLEKDQWTPTPWINVIANSLDFGFLVTESGASHTWSLNSRENRMTPWSNDPVTDPTGEALYIRDEQTGEIWSPTPLPIRNEYPYLISHGQGYTKFKHISHEIEQSLNMFVLIDQEIKVTILTLKNLSSVSRELSVTSYIEWVLGVHREDSAAHIVTEYNEETKAVFASNSYNNEFATRISYSFMTSSNIIEKKNFTCDRREFLGRNGNYQNPEGLRKVELTKSVGAGLDPCTAWQSIFELTPGQEIKILILLGQCPTSEKAEELIKKYGHLSVAESEYEKVISHWEETLSKVEITTPDLAMNTLVNRWLPYQVLSCRIWGRTAMYQSGGAYGFRDQLQDVMALIYSRPEITRAQILIHARRQFREGDVQHWWHPPTGRGVRTHFSDDLIWLPFVVNFYLKVTGDYSILDEVVPFLEAPLLDQSQEDAYLHPEISEDVATIYEHCTRALDKSLKLGVHGLPLIGSGDWNDGMNRIGHKGQGESVWVGWFLYQTLEDFLPLCKRLNENKRVKEYSEYLGNLKKSLEHEAWDGQWYRRAFFDDGTPVGSDKNEECKIDSISQSWAILSNAANKERGVKAMQAVEKHLINWDDKLIKLFTPPFDKTATDPGYIKGYLPGVRENGGQYTHAAIWVMMAFAKLGDGEKATKIFQLLNPINHNLNNDDVMKYKAEPYALAADVYVIDPHIGRGGWSWYTGSASWMYRAALESILGFEKRSNQFKVSPRVPLDWSGFQIVYFFGKTRYEIILKKDEPSFKHQSDEWIEMLDDGVEHLIEISF